MFLGNVLEDFGAALVAGIGVDKEERFDFADAGDDASDGDELTKMFASDVTDGKCDVGRERLEVEVAVRWLGRAGWTLTTLTSASRVERGTQSVQPLRFQG